MEPRKKQETPSGRLYCLTTHKEYDIFQPPGKLTIGRSRDNDLILDSRNISKFHCELAYQSPLGLVLQDCSSSGTWVNEKRLGHGREKWCIIQPGDAISLGVDGRHKFLYLQEDTTAPTPPSGSIWSRYTCGKVLGSGAFGTVYRCQEKTTRTLYAMKVIDRQRFHLLQDAEKMFQGEIQSLKALKSNHENIVQLKEIIDERPMLYLALEYVPGGDLGRYLGKKPPLPENIAAELTAQICKGVAFIHEQGIAHRDLKPENILLTIGNPLTLKIADFGLAKVIDGGTFLRTRCGTPDYLAPEVIQPSELGYSENVDCWSVGVIAFEMLTKDLPFRWDPSSPQDFWSGESRRILEFGELQQVNCSAQGIAFVESLVREVPTARITIFRALKHEWLNIPSPVNLDRTPQRYRRLAPPPRRAWEELPTEEPNRLTPLIISASFFLFAVLYELWKPTKGDGI